MKNNLLSEDIQRFKSIINYNPSYGLINESVISAIFKNLTGDVLKSTFRNFLKDTLKVDLKNIGKTNITLITKDKLTKDGEKFVQKILTDAGQTATVNSLKKEEQFLAFRMVKEAQQAIDSKILSKLGGNISKDSVSRAFVAMTKSQKLTKESIELILTNFGKSKDLFKTLKVSSNKSLLILDDVSQSVFNKPYSSLTQIEKDALKRTINGMNPKKLRQALIKELVVKTDSKVLNKLKKLWGGVKRLPKTKVLKWTAGLGLSAWAIYAIIKYWDDDVTIEDEDKEKVKKDEDGDGGGGSGDSSTSYTTCTNFPYKKWCNSSIVAEVQKCLGIVDDGKFGPKTEKALSDGGYGSEITQDVYNKIKEICGTNNTVNTTITTTLPGPEFQDLEVNPDSITI